MQKNSTDENNMEPVNNRYVERKVLLQRVKGCSFCAIPTVMTYDMGLQYDYVTPEGAGTELGSMGQWPAYWFAKIPDDKWQKIRNALSESKLTLDLMLGTDLHAFAQQIEENYYDAEFREIETNDMFSGLLSLPEILPERFYALFDMGFPDYEDHRPEFFASEVSFRDSFRKSYCTYVTPWEEMDDEDLSYWSERIDTEFDSFPYYHFSGNDNSEEDDDD